MNGIETCNYKVFKYHEIIYFIEVAEWLEDKLIAVNGSQYMTDSKHNLLNRDAWVRSTTKTFRREEIKHVEVTERQVQHLINMLPGV